MTKNKRLYECTTNLENFKEGCVYEANIRPDGVIEFLNAYGVFEPVPYWFDYFEELDGDTTDNAFKLMHQSDKFTTANAAVLFLRQQQEFEDLYVKFYGHVYRYHVHDPSGFNPAKPLSYVDRDEFKQLLEDTASMILVREGY